MATVFGTTGNDAATVGTAADDTIYGGATTSPAGTGNDTIDAGAGNDTVYGGDGTDALTGNVGRDTMFGGDGADALSGGSGDDSLLGGAGDDAIDGGEGNDRMAGGAGADRFNGGTGLDMVDYSDSSSAVTVSLQGGSGSRGDAEGDSYGGTDGIVGSAYGDSLTGFDGENFQGSDVYWNIIEGGGGNDTIDGLGGADELFGGTGDDLVVGGAGVDTVDGGAGNDSVRGGTGNDVVRGGDGADTVYVAPSDGVDTAAGGEGGLDQDTLVLDPLTGTTAVNLTFTGNESGSYSFGTGSGTFIEIERVATGAGADAIDASATTGGVSVASGGGADTIVGGTGADSLDGGAGNDTLTGGDGHDTLGGGSGADRLAGGLGNDSLSGGADGDTIVVGASQGVDTIEGGATGADADTLAFEDILGARAPSGVTVTFTGAEAGDYAYGLGSGRFTDIERVTATSAGDTLDASGVDSGLTLSGVGGADTLRGGSGADTLFGGTGADSIAAGGGGDLVQGDDGDDTLGGGLGDDRVLGGEGSDTIHMAASEGTDVVAGGEAGSDRDTLSFDAGPVGGAGVAVTYASNEAGSFAFGTGSGAFSEMERVTGSASADTIDASRTTGGVTVSTGDGADVVRGGAGADAITAGAGADSVRGNAGADRIDLGADDAHDVVSLANGDGADTLTNFQAPTQNPDGSWTGHDMLDLTGLTTADGVPVTLRHVAVGADGFGNAVLTFPGGESLTLEGVPPATLTPAALFAMGIPYPDGLVDGTQGDDDIGADYLGDPDGDRVDGGDALLPGAAPQDDWIRAGDGRDKVLAGEGDDRVEGGGDDDSLFGGDGDDSLEGGDGDDVVSGGLGDDSLEGGLGNDVLQGAEGRDTLFGGEGNDELAGLDDDDSISGGVGDDNLAGGLGQDVLDGDAGNDGLDGGAGDDSLAGGEGDDRLSGGEGRDDLEGGAGRDEIEGGGGDDSLGGNAGVDTLYGGDGQDSLAGGADEDRLSGGVGDDRLDGGGGNDLLFGEAGSDRLDGAGGDDTVYGGLGDDASVGGGDGNDLVSGRYGDDTVFGGTGDDTVFGDIDDSGTGARQFAVFDTDASGTSGTAPNGTFTFTGTGGPVTTEAVDDDARLEGPPSSGGGDATGGQTLAYDTRVGGVTYSAGTPIYAVSHSEITNATTGQSGQAWLIQVGSDPSATVWSFGIPVNPGDQIAWTTGPDAADTSGLSYEDLTQADGSLAVGDDTLHGGDGRDTLLGADGDDSLSGDAGDDSLSGGEGADALAGGDGDDRLDGGDGADVLTGGAGDDSLAGGRGDDLLRGGGGADTLLGGDGADRLTGDEGSDSMSGGAGDDRLLVGAGDVADGGNGDDTFTLDDLGEGGGTGSITVTGGEGDEVTGDTLQLGRGADLSTLVITDMDDDGGGLSGHVTLDDGTVLFFDEIEKIICFAGGTLIATPRGEVAVEDLTVGDLVVTRDHGLQAIRWIGARQVPALGRLAPIRIRPGVVPGLVRDLVVSPQHKMLFTGPRAELLFGESEVLVPATHLVDGVAVTREEGGAVTYHHVLFDRHEIIYAEGAATESFHPGELGLDAVDDAAREELFVIFPELRLSPASYGRAARRSLRRHEARLLQAGLVPPPTTLRTSANLGRGRP